MLVAYYRRQAKHRMAEGRLTRCGYVVPLLARWRIRESERAFVSCLKCRRAKEPVSL